MKLIELFVTKRLRPQQRASTEIRHSLHRLRKTEFPLDLSRQVKVFFSGELIYGCGRSLVH